MTALKQTAVALALGLAQVASAQAPARAPAPPRALPQPQQPQQQAGAPSTLSNDQLVWIGAARWFSEFQSSFGKLGATKASAAEVKEFARRVGDDHQRIAAQLAAAMQQRGVNPTTLPQPADLKQIEDESRQVAARSGDDFDRAFVSLVRDHGERIVDALKMAREATPGSDAALKKFLDESEDVEEATLTAARQLYAKRVQARTPPGR
jgi:putative membrane protein